MRGRAMRRARIAMTAMLIAAAAPAVAQPGPPPPGQLVITGQTAITDGGPPNGGGVEWFHSLPSRPVTIDVGAFTGAGRRAWFTYGRVGGLARTGRLVLTTTLDVGGGEEGSRGFGYARVRALATAPVRSSRLHAEADVDHVRVSGRVVTGLRAGTAIQLTPRLSMRLSAHTFASDGIVDPGASIRSDVTVRRTRLFGGVFASRRSTSPASPVPVDVTPTLYATRSVFGGADIAVNGCTLTIVVDVSRRATGNAASMLAGLKVPLR